ncbi:MAG: hypothetical protein M1290_01910 [Candidatus Thermoplasmatota archaeon]|nr:hypothetical protein [Candidatus Thermoplasmatota archaeon]MCL5789204.1 hypothetical protein [Candidatus Thermoplasmatota archaeon]
MIKLPKNKKFPVRGGYQSLTKLNKFIVDVIEGNYEEDNITDEVVYSEIRGIREVEDKDFYNQQSQTNGKKILDAFADRKAIYKGGYKCVVTGRSGQVEEFTKHGKEVDSNNILLKDLLTPLQDFSTTARDDFTINL